MSQLKRINCLSFSKRDLDKLEYIKDGNQLPNFDDFVKSVLGDRIEDIFELWVFTNKQMKYTQPSRKTFDHELGTLLISCKMWVSQFSHGSKYGSLVVTEYQNNSIPNLYEISVSWPNHSYSPIDILEDMREE